MITSTKSAPQRIVEALGPMRLPFLLLAIACVFLGIGTAVMTAGQVNTFQAALTIIGAVAAHISVNAFNEYADFRSGLDARTHRTPFSGGSGTLPNNPKLAPVALGIAISTFLLTGAIGLFFLWIRGAAMLPLGVLGLLIVLVYTPWMIRHPLLCLLAPGMGFGPCIIIGTQIALTGQFTIAAVVASLIPFFFVNDLLLLNQFPDIEADRSVGRRHFPLLIGPRASSVIYAAFLLLGYVALATGVFLGYLPKLSLLGMATILLAIPAIAGAFRFAERGSLLLPALGMNVIINIATPTLMAIGMLIK